MNNHERTRPYEPVSEHAPADDTSKPGQNENTADQNRTVNHVAGELPTKTFDHTPSDSVGSEDLAEQAMEVVPGYQLLGKLGEGGMGVVYKARHTKLNRIVALKRMLGEHAGRGELIRFLAEAEAVAAIKHENVVQVFDYGEADGRPYMALEFCPGGTLAMLLPKDRSAATAPRKMADLITRVASGVAAAHALGIIHRDIKPGNILLDDSGVPKVADFGLAKRGAGSDVTQDGTRMGTPAYMAPEQGRDAKFAGPQADVWALGVILYESLTGGRPFRGTVQEIMAQAQNAEPIPPCKVVTSVPHDLELICLKCLAKAPHERYPTAKELVDDLNRFLRDEPISVRPAGVAERVVKWVRRKPTAAAAYGFSTLAIALALVVFVIFGFWREAEGAKKQLQTANTELADEKKQTEAARDDALTQKSIADAARIEEERLRGIAEAAKVAEEAARLQVEREREKLVVFEYGKTMQVAHQEWRDNNLLTMRALLDGTDPKLRNWEWHYLDRLCNGSLLTLKGHTQGVGSASFSTDGTRIVTASADGTAKVWDTRTGAELLTLKQFTRSVNSASFSPDGTRIVTGSFDNTAQVWDAKTGAEILSFKGPTNKALMLTVNSATFSADGSRIVTASDDLTAKVWDAKTGAELLTLNGHRQSVHSASFSADGTRIVTGSADSTAKIWDAKTGTALLTLKGHYGWVTSASFSPDGTRIVTGTTDHSPRVWDANTGAELLTLKGHTKSAFSASFSADGTRIVTASEDRTVKVWDAKTGVELMTLKGHTNWVRSASFSADDSLIVTASNDKTAKIWDAKIGAEVLPIKVQAYLGRSASYSADGTRFVTASSDKPGKVFNPMTGTSMITNPTDRTAQVWDAKTGAELLILKGHTGFVYSASFSADGTRIVTGSQDRTAKVWDAETGAEILTLKGHTGFVSSASFSADGTRIVTASVDKTAKVWDAKTGAELIILKGHEFGLSSASFSADGKRIRTTSVDKMVKIWDASSGAEWLKSLMSTGEVAPPPRMKP